MLRTFKNVLKNRRYFLVTSHGNTGTFWLANNLNNHSEIFCTHSYIYPILEPLQKRVIQRSGIKMKYNVERNFWKLSVSEFFNQHEEVTEQRVIGNVHAFTFGRFWGMRPRQGYLRQKLNIMNMVRHPVDRINSCYHTWHKKDDPNFVDRVDSFINKDFQNNCHHILNFINEKKYKLDMNTKAVRCFVVALLQSEHVANDVALTQKNNIESFIFEKIAEKDKDYYSKKFTALTKMGISYDDITFTDEVINQHNPVKGLTTKEQFQQWDDWKQEAFKFVCQRNNMEDTYAPYSYDLSFLR